MTAPTPFTIEPQSIIQALLQRAADSPHAVAFASRGEAITYRTLLDDADLLAGRLSAAGVRRGTPVPLVIAQGLTFPRVYFALLRLGALPCALDPHMPADLISRRAAALSLDPVLLVESSTTSLGSAAETIRVIALDDLPQPEPVRFADPDGNDLALLQSTSGTSGEPKTAAIRHRNVMAAMRIGREVTEARAGDVYAGWVPPWHDLGLIRYLLGPIHAGAACHIIPAAVRTIPEWIRTIGEARATITSAPDFAYRLAARMAPAQALTSLRIASNGAEPVRSSTIRSFEERFAVPGVVRPGYGLAEATLSVTCMRIGEPLRVDRSGNVSCGRVLPGLAIRLAQDGEILVSGDSVFAGYFDERGLDSSPVKDGVLATGDIGSIDSDGHLYVFGRKRAIIKRGGAIIAPREIEEAVAGTCSVRAVAAIGIAGATREHIVVIVETDGQNAAGLASDAALAVERQVGVSADRVVVVRSRTIPLTHNGKVRYTALRDALIEGVLHENGSVLCDSVRD